MYLSLALEVGYAWSLFVVQLLCLCLNSITCKYFFSRQCEYSFSLAFQLHLISNLARWFKSRSIKSYCMHTWYKYLLLKYLIQLGRQGVREYSQLPIKKAFDYVYKNKNIVASSTSLRQIRRSSSSMQYAYIYIRRNSYRWSEEKEWPNCLETLRLYRC